MPHRFIQLAGALTALLTLSCAGPSPTAESRIEPTPPLRLVTYNIKHGHGMDGVVNLDRIAAVLRPLDADVIFLQEVDQGCARSGQADQPAALAGALGLESRFGAFRPYDGGRYGMAILTRLPVRRAEVIALPPGPNPLTCLELELDFHGTSITVTGLHLVMTEAQRLAQARFLANRYRDASRPIILAGDLNSERESPILDVLGAQFDYPAKRAAPLTFPSVDPVKEIDFFLFAPKGAWTIDDHRVVDETMASDHRPVSASARLPALRSGR